MHKRSRDTDQYVDMIDIFSKLHENMENLISELEKLK